MAIDPSPVPPPGIPKPLIPPTPDYEPVEEPEPDRLPDEVPLPNPDEDDQEPKRLRDRRIVVA